MALITLTTDFGVGEYTARMKGVIPSLLPGCSVVDVLYWPRGTDVKLERVR